LSHIAVDSERLAALEAKTIDAAMLQRVATKVMTSKVTSSQDNQAKIPYQNTRHQLAN
jgi:hypothetical protein